MVAIGMALGWVGYSLAIWGYCLIRDYNVRPADLVKTTWPGTGTGKGTVSSQVVPSPSGQPSKAQQYTGQ